MSSQSIKQTTKQAQAKSIALPTTWPTWLQYLAVALVFLAGVGVGLLWQMAPWSVIGLALFVFTTVLILRFK